MIEKNTFTDAVLGMDMVPVDVNSNENLEFLSDGSVEVVLERGGEAEEGLVVADFGANLAEFLGDDELNAISLDLIGLVDADIDSRKDWAETFVKGLDVLGLKYEERTEPWENACGVYSTILSEAAIRFQADTMLETFPAGGPVKTKIIGEVTKDKEEAAARVKADMNYELTEVMTEYRPEHERMLYTLGLAGSAFKKVYFDPHLGRQVAIFIPPEDVIVPYGAANLETAERVTHVMRKTKNELLRAQASGFYRDVDLGDPKSFHTDIEERKAEQQGYELSDDDRYALLEVHVDYVLPGVDPEGSLPKPYIVTIDRGTNVVLSIYRNWDEADPRQLRRNHFVHYTYVPGFGFYGLGLIHIVGGYARAGTSIVRQLVDSGTLANLPGGFKSKGLRVKGDDTPISPAEWRDVDVPSGSIKDNILPLPYKEPSQTLLALLDRITEEGRRLGAIADIEVSDMSANAPVGTTLALLERTLKPMTAVQARVHASMKQEFKLLKALIAEYAPDEYSYVPDRAEPRARKRDYAVVDVIPVSDPNSSTMAQRVVQYQTAMQMAKDAPQIYDLPMLHRQMLEVIGIRNADKIVPTKDDILPADPVSENMNFLVGKPTKAFISQDHDAHIQVHQAFLQDPQIMAFIGQNPAAQQVVAAIQAHIAEHVAFSYRKQIEDKLGANLPPPSEQMPEELEVLLSQVMADAARQLTQQKQQAAAMQQAQQQAQDPVFQQQQKELEIKAADVQRKVIKDAEEVRLAKERLELEKARESNQAATNIIRELRADKESGEQSNMDKARLLLELSQQSFNQVDPEPKEGGDK